MAGREKIDSAKVLERDDLRLRHFAVIAGLDPAIHPFAKFLAKQMDARVKPAHDDST
jgi:hypothetical protein